MYFVLHAFTPVIIPITYISTHCLVCIFPSNGSFTSSLNHCASALLLLPSSSHIFHHMPVSHRHLEKHLQTVQLLSFQAFHSITSQQANLPSINMILPLYLFSLIHICHQQPRLRLNHGLPSNFLETIGLLYSLTQSPPLSDFPQSQYHLTYLTIFLLQPHISHR